MALKFILLCAWIYCLLGQSSVQAEVILPNSKFSKSKDENVLIPLKEAAKTETPIESTSSSKHSSVLVPLLDTLMGEFLSGSNSISSSELQCADYAESSESSTTSTCTNGNLIEIRTEWIVVAGMHKEMRVSVKLMGSCSNRTLAANESADGIDLLLLQLVPGIIYIDHFELGRDLRSLLGFANAVKYHIKTHKIDSESIYRGSTDGHGAFLFGIEILNITKSFEFSILLHTRYHSPISQDTARETCATYNENSVPESVHGFVTPLCPRRSDEGTKNVLFFIPQTLKFTRTPLFTAGLDSFFEVLVDDGSQDPNAYTGYELAFGTNNFPSKTLKLYQKWLQNENFEPSKIELKENITSEAGAGSFQLNGTGTTCSNESSYRAGKWLSFPVSDPHLATSLAAATAITVLATTIWIGLLSFGDKKPKRRAIA